MKKTIISGVLLSAFIAVTIPTITQAESHRPMMKNEQRGQGFGSSTRMMDNSSTTRRQNTSNIGGVVNTVNTSSFTIDNVGRNNATTTYTVNIDTNTVYRSGTTTTSLSAITSGKHVMISGDLSTTTKNITAKVINIINPDLRNNDMKKYAYSSTTNPNANGMYHKMMNWFKNKFK